MNELAKQGFSQSYTYFTWRNTKAELIEYVTELTQSSQKEFYRPNFWPNTQILTLLPCKEVMNRFICKSIFWRLL